MQIDNFMNLIKSGFDVSFNYKDVFYTISLIDENESERNTVLDQIIISLLILILLNLFLILY